MTGMLAVIAHDRLHLVGESEIESLADGYEAQRGPGRRHSAHAGTFARLIKIDTDSADRPGIERRSSGWAGSTGVVHGADMLMDADLARIDGQFALVRFAADRDELLVATDPLGLHALYTAEHDGKTYISSSALVLARHLGSRPDPVALAMLMCCGTQHGSLTCWVGIERLAPATALWFTGEGRRRETYWRPVIDERVAGMSFGRAVDHTIAVMSDTIKRHLSGRRLAWADLTGGYDTRLLTVMMDRVGVAFRANTVGMRANLDVQLGRRVARAAGWDWTHFHVPENWPALAPTLLDDALAWADGRLPVVQLTQVLWTQQRKGAAHRVSFAGGGGEFLRGHAWRQEMFRIGRTRHVDLNYLINMTLLSDEALAMLNPPLAAAVPDYLHQLMADQVRPYTGELNTTQLDVLMAYRKPLWDGIYGSAAGRYICSDLPLLYRPIFTTAISIHYRHRQYRRLMRAIVARLNPSVAVIPTAFGGPTVPLRVTSAHRYAPFYARLGRIAASRVALKTLGWSVWQSKSPADPRIVKAQRSILDSLALSEQTMRSAVLFKPGALSDLLTRAQSPDFAGGDMLGRVITVEMAMRAAEP
jgi:hypothetical protein